MFSFMSQEVVSQLRAEIADVKSSTKNQISEVNDEIVKQVALLRVEIQHKATDSEQMASQAAMNAQSYADNVRALASNIQVDLEAISTFRQEISSVLEVLKADCADVEQRKSELSAQLVKLNKIYENLVNSSDSIGNISEQVNEFYDEIKRSLEASKELPADVEKVKSYIVRCDELFEAMSGLLDHSAKKKGDIDDLHRKIYGQDVNLENGDSEHIDGLKDELDNSFKKISNEISGLKRELALQRQSIVDEFTSNLNEQKTKVESIVGDANSKVDSVYEQLQSLLPGSMAAGLSAAYEDKKNDERNYLLASEKTFSYAIVGMVFVSLIPFGVDAYLLGWKGYHILDVIKDTPGLIFSILPLYFPFLWVAYSSNKKINLSKRLIEDYAHKSALGRTFSGLSNQINDLPHENAIKEDLRLKLLFNVLQMSAENPGKLITDYSKADHPVMEALEKSAKLTDAIDAIAKIPGFGALAKKLSERSELMAKEQVGKVVNGLDVNDLIQAEDKKD